MNLITITRTAHDLVVTTPAGELGFILRPECKTDGYEAWANLIPGVEDGQAHGFARATVSTFARLRDAVAFITTEGVAL